MLAKETNKMNSGITEDGSVDRKGRPAVRAKTGGWKSATLLLGNNNQPIDPLIYIIFQLIACAVDCVVNFGLVTLAFFGVGVNLVLFLTRVMQQENAEAANNVSKWTGTVYIFSLIGAFMSDSYWGRYLTCSVFQSIYVLVQLLLS